MGWIEDLSMSFLFQCRAWGVLDADSTPIRRVEFGYGLKAAQLHSGARFLLFAGL